MKVYFEVNFWGHRQKERAGKRVELNQSFEWDGDTWLIPAAYLCSKGLVVDFCKMIPRHRIQSLMNQWEEKAEHSQLSPEEYELLEFENPMSNLIHFKASINGRLAEGVRMCAVCWNPFRSETEQEAKEVSELVEEYQCDKEQGWQFTRAAIPWPYKRRPEKISLTLNLEPYTLPYPCGQHFNFCLDDDSRQLQVSHPVNNQVYTLTISGMRSEVLSEECFQRLSTYEYPKYFATLSYHYHNDIADQVFVIQDCAQSDQPRRIPGQARKAGDPDGVASVGIIGGVSAALKPDQEKEDRIREQYAISSLHFEPVNQVDWRISAMITRGEALTLKLPMIIKGGNLIGSRE
jgi:hypothetical protein